MGLTFVKDLPTPVEIREQFPLEDNLAQLKSQKDEEVKKIITCQSSKFLVLIGPCSADNEDAVCDYTNTLKQVNIGTKGTI